MDKKNYLINIWLINGVIFLILTLVGLGLFLKEVFFAGRDAIHVGAVVGDDKSSDIEANRLLQTIDFDEFSKIYNSSYSLLRISEIDYEVAKYGSRKIVVQNIPATKQLRMVEAPYYRSSYRRNAACINLLFYSEQSMDSRLLVDKIAFISHINYPNSVVDSLQNFILYEITFTDTNNDSRLNAEDKGNIFISDLNGTGLKQLTPDTLTVYDYQYNPEHGKIYFKTKALKESIRKEHIDFQIYTYDLLTNTFVQAEELNQTLEKSRQILINAF